MLRNSIFLYPIMTELVDHKYSICRIYHVKLKQDLHSNSECHKQYISRFLLKNARVKKKRKTNKSSHFSLRRISREQLEGARLIPKHVRFYGRGGRNTREIDKSRVAPDGKQKLKIRKEALVKPH